MRTKISLKILIREIIIWTALISIANWMTKSKCIIPPDGKAKSFLWAIPVRLFQSDQSIDWVYTL